MARTGFSYSEEITLREVSANRLIKQKKCSRTKTGVYTHPCYGDDINTLDGAREWLYYEGLEHNMTSEQARIFANKLVLYVDPVELEAEYQKLLRQAVTA